MRKILGITIIILFFVLFASALFISGHEFYNQSKHFYKSNFNGEVVKIEDGRGTKVFYNSTDYFCTDFCTNSFELENTIKVGDVVKKHDSILEIFREDDKKKWSKL